METQNSCRWIGDCDLNCLSRCYKGKTQQYNHHNDPNFNPMENTNNNSGMEGKKCKCNTELSKNKESCPICEPQLYSNIEKAFENVAKDYAPKEVKTADQLATDYASENCIIRPMHESTNFSSLHEGFLEGYNLANAQTTSIIEQLKEVKKKVKLEIFDLLGNRNYMDFTEISKSEIKICDLIDELLTKIQNQR